MYFSFLQHLSSPLLASSPSPFLFLFFQRAVDTHHSYHFWIITTIIMETGREIAIAVMEGHGFTAGRGPELGMSKVSFTAVGFPVEINGLKLKGYLVVDVFKGIAVTIMCLLAFNKCFLFMTCCPTSCCIISVKV